MTTWDASLEDQKERQVRRRPLTGMFVDTNVLVAARFVNAFGHVAACRCLDRAGNGEEPLNISRQIVREYLATVTRPQTWSEPLAMADALGDAANLVSSFRLLEDGPNVMAMLTALCRAVPVAGKQVHDANIAATMLAHGERRLLTFNAKDFLRYKERIELVDLENAA